MPDPKTDPGHIETSLSEVLEALDESVQLQSHYAALLNQYDSGERLTFADGMAWIVRLRECKRAAAENDDAPCLPDQHQWVRRRAGGDPAEAGSYEVVTYCQVCGAEKEEDD